MLNRTEALRIARLFRFFDATCRQDLSTRRILSERDYVSNLAAHIRYPHGAVLSPRLLSAGKFLNKGRIFHTGSPRFVSVTSAPNIEQEYGCDSIIIFSFDLGKGRILHRVGMYEAKWPRLKKNSTLIANGWDDIGWKPINKKRVPPPPKIYKSRFTNEVLRQQALIHSGVVVWEQFFCQQNVLYWDASFRMYGSTCVWHKHAHRYLIDNPWLQPGPGSDFHGPSSRAWNEQDLTSLLQRNSLSFGYLIYLMLRPNRIGKYLTAVNNEIRIAASTARRPSKAENYHGSDLAYEQALRDDNDRLITIPVFTNDDAAADFPDTIAQFMRASGINSYVHITIDAGFIPEKELNAFLHSLANNQ